MKAQHDLVPKILRAHIKGHGGIHCVCTNCVKCGECILCDECDCVGGPGLMLSQDCDGPELQAREVKHGS